MSRSRLALCAGIAAAAVLALGAAPASAKDGGEQLRFATFNASLNRYEPGQLVSVLSSPGNPQVSNVAEIIQRVRPDVLLINEFDYAAGGQAVELFQKNYLGQSQHGAKAIQFPYTFVAESNTGLPSGKDLDNDGTVTQNNNDALGFGAFPGQFGLAVLSRKPIAYDEIRTFQKFLWKDMPGALLPDDPATPVPADWYSPDELDIFRLSSKSHWDVPIKTRHGRIHFLVSHPTPPVFDGAEDRNGTRNHDEIRLWSDYVSLGRGGYLYDDEGGRGGLPKHARFVIAGDQNADPLDGDSTQGAIQQLLDNPRINTSSSPTSLGGPQQAALQGGANASHRGDPAYDTADFNDNPAPGNLRADYVLPSRRGLKVIDAGVFWPVRSDPLSRLTGEFPFPTSDHRLVWVDVRVR
jgi:Endonuclease/Exonuclease/phosphatase family